ncbi:nitrous oxide reductase family maturation protein NosD, partial [Chloroflexota bacterium]
MKAKMIYVIAIFLVSSLALVIMPANPVSAQSIWYVDDDNCPGPGSGAVGDPFCKIQDAIDAASAGDTIEIAAGTYYEYSITIDKSLTVQGAGMDITIIDAQYMSNVFRIGDTVDMSGMTIQNGKWSMGGGIGSGFEPLTLTDCIIKGNEVSMFGGGIVHEGPLTMTNCTVSGNKAEINGGGIGRAFGVSADLKMTNCTISENTANHGGGIYNWFSLIDLTGCTISGNTAVNQGGGIYCQGDIALTNCTISGNTAMDIVHGNGGGICTTGENVTLTSCT